MKINYKLSLLILLFGAVVISSNSVFAQGLRNDTLYFCEEYKDGKEIGNANEFYLPEKGGTITVMLRTKKPVGVVEIFIHIERMLRASEIMLLKSRLMLRQAGIIFSLLIYSSLSRVNIK
jgi:hypothetical protein